MAETYDAMKLLAEIEAQIMDAKPDTGKFSFPDGKYQGTFQGVTALKVQEWKMDIDGSGRKQVIPVPVFSFQFLLRAGPGGRTYVNRTYYLKLSLNKFGRKNDNGDVMDFAKYKGVLKQLGLPEDLKVSQLIQEIGPQGDKRAFMEAHGLKSLPTVKFELKTVPSKDPAKQPNQYPNILALVDESEVGQLDDVASDLPPTNDDIPADAFDSPASTPAEDLVTDEPLPATEAEDTQLTEESLLGEEEHDQADGGDVGLDMASPHPLPEAIQTAPLEDVTEFLGSLPDFVEGSLEGLNEAAVRKVASVASCILHDKDVEMGSAAARLIIKVFGMSPKEASTAAKVEIALSKKLQPKKLQTTA